MEKSEIVNLADLSYKFTVYIILRIIRVESDIDPLRAYSLRVIDCNEGRSTKKRQINITLEHCYFTITKSEKTEFNIF